MTTEHKTSLNPETIDKCNQCARPPLQSITIGCEFCSKMEFFEEILCDLNRLDQSRDDFSCRGFQPILKVVKGADNRSDSRMDNNVYDRVVEEGKKGPPLPFFEKLLDQDKSKYMKPVALQRPEDNPDKRIIRYKGHLVWNTLYRKPVFNSTRGILDVVHDLFYKNRIMIGCSVYLLWLACDHIHVFIESDGRDSIGTIVHKIQKDTNRALLNHFPALKKEFTGPTGIWNEAYFVEMIR